MVFEKIALPCIYHTMMLMLSTSAPVATQLFTKCVLLPLIQPT